MEPHVLQTQRLEHETPDQKAVAMSLPANDSASTVAQEQLVTWCTTRLLGPDSANAGCRCHMLVLLVPG